MALSGPLLTVRIVFGSPWIYHYSPDSESYRGSYFKYIYIYIFKRLTPDSRAPAKQGEGLCLAGSLGGKEKSKKVVADDVSEHKLRNISPT